MARKRMLDPGIWDSEQVMGLTCNQFKLYIYLISQADDEGRVKVSVPLFRSRVHPLDEYSIEQTATDLETIATSGLVRLYRVNGDTYLHHPNWHVYQKINRPTESKYPFSEDSVSPHGILTPNRIEKKRKEKNRNEECADSAAPHSEQDRHLYHLIKDAFLIHNADFDFKREGRHIKSIEEKSVQRDDPPEFAKRIITVFWKLLHSEDPFWNKQPFLPSVLNSGGIWPRVLKELENTEQAHSISEEVKEAVRGINFGQKDIHTDGTRLLREVHTSSGDGDGAELPGRVHG